MKKSAILLASLVAFCAAIYAQTYDNQTKEYELVSQTEANIEVTRTHRRVLCDYQPTGLYVRRGEKLAITVTDLDEDYKLSTMIGFKPMWGNHNKTQENELKDGENAVAATQDGILSFIFVKRSGFDNEPSTVNVSVKGGKAFPFYIVNVTEDADWESDLKKMTDAPFVQLLSDKALLTITYNDYIKHPIPDVEASFETIHKMIDLEEELAGFDDSSPENKRTRNRLNFAIDLYSTPAEATKYYLYASNYFIGMKRSNFTDLTEKLDTEWGIWHEVGHTHQQQSWTWSSIIEVNTNIFSLYVQERFGLPSKLNDRQVAGGPTTFEKAKVYIADLQKNYMVRNPTDYDELFTKLVMFHQLKTVYGWDTFKKLHQHFRKQPYRYDPKETDADKANKFVYAMCGITKNNLVPFFQKWGLAIDAPTVGKIRGLNLPLPTADPSKILQ